MRGKNQINLVFHSLFRISGFAEDTHARKNSNKFGFSLTFSYLCSQINQTIHIYEYKRIETHLREACDAGA